MLINLTLVGQDQILLQCDAAIAFGTTEYIVEYLINMGLSRLVVYNLIADLHLCVESDTVLTCK